MQLKVLLVDDEFLVRLGIKSLIDWEKHRFSYVGDAQDGLEALDMIERTRPDIVLTDIVMPRMNGIELIQRMKEQVPDTHIIVLSSHNDYEYVRKAMKLGVEDYILKASLKPEELLGMLLEVADKIKRSRSQAGGRTDASTETAQEDKDEFAQALRGWLQPPSNREQAADGSDRLVSHPLFAAEYVLACLKIHRGKGTSEPAQTLMQKLINLASLQLKNKYNAIVQAVDENLAVILMNDSSAAAAVGEQIIADSRRFLNISISVGLSAEAFGIEQLHRAFSEAREALRLSFYEGKERVYCYEENLYPPPLSFAGLITREDEQRLTLELERLNAEALKRSVHAILDRIGKWTGPIDKSIQLMLRLLHLVQNGLKLYNEDILNGLEAELPLYKQVLGFEELSEARAWFDRIIETGCEQGKQAGVGMREEIQRLVEYMKMNYAENISLKQAAEMVNMSETYLSHLFKKETQVGFVEFLNQIRIGKAAELLLQTRLPVYAIAEKVGFENFNYFGRIFKKMKGVSPQNYRDNEQD